MSIEFCPNISEIPKSFCSFQLNFKSGWGLEESNGQPSEVLKKIELPAVSREECERNSSPEFINFITPDKFCAGYLTGASVCQGDSGKSSVA